MDRWPDIVNGLYELLGGLFVLMHVRQLLKDKEVKGMALTPLVFFMSWGLWNLYFYPWAGAWWSFWGGCGVAASNVLWVGLAFYYKYWGKKKVGSY